MPQLKTIVYVLKSTTDPSRYYTGLTSDITARLNAHNAGRVPHTADGKPWTVDVVVEFADERRAIAFEKYLKSGSDARSHSGISDEAELAAVQHSRSWSKSVRDVDDADVQAIP